jgi:Tfp pilus assembly protein PilX
MTTAHTKARGRAAVGRRPLVRRAKGIALPAVVAVGAAVAALTGAWFEAALTEARRTRALSDRLIAFHAADAALAACTARLEDGTARYLKATSGAEPDAWRRASAFTTPEAIEPFVAWPMAARPPRCLIEAWDLRPFVVEQRYLVTARGVGAHASTAAWLQMQVLIHDGRIVARRWRHVAAAG